jgi:hypothetical protein
MLTDSSRTDFCPLGHRCESCGAESPGLRVVTHGVLNATLCLTLCPRCAGSGRPPQIMLSTAERLVAAHVAHLRSRDEPVRARYRSGGRPKEW